MSVATLTIDDVNRLTSGRIGTFDAPCPLCGPSKSTRGQRRRVLRVWRIDANFASFHCARCGERGYAREETSRHRSIDRAAIAKARAEADERERIATAERLEKARWLWSQRRPIEGTPAERYLREARGYQGPLPATLAYLPPRGEHAHALIAAFGMATIRRTVKEPAQKRDRWPVAQDRSARRRCDQGFYFDPEHEPRGANHRPRSHARNPRR
jgi:hypothetical protein